MKVKHHELGHANIPSYALNKFLEHGWVLDEPESDPEQEPKQDEIKKRGRPRKVE